MLLRCKKSCQVYLPFVSFFRFVFLVKVGVSLVGFCGALLRAAEKCGILLKLMLTTFLFSSSSPGQDSEAQALKAIDIVDIIEHIISMKMKQAIFFFFAGWLSNLIFMGFLMCCWFGVVQILQKTMIQVELVFKRGLFCPCLGSLSPTLLVHYKSRVQRFE